MLGRESRHNMSRLQLFVVVAFLVLSAAAQKDPEKNQPAAKPVVQADSGTIAEVYFWKAKPCKLDEYNRYIREFAEPIDMEAQRTGAFLSVRTYLATRPDAPWTHMRIFVLRDKAQQAGLSAALDAAKIR